MFELAETERKKIVLLVVLFSLVTPAGIVLGDWISSHVGAGGLTILTALAAGTFLYVCLCELLAEVFHHREDTLERIVLLAGGIAVMALFEGVAH